MEKTVTITLKATDLGILLYALLLLGMGKSLNPRERIVLMTKRLRIEREISAQLPSGMKEGGQ